MSPKQVLRFFVIIIIALAALCLLYPSEGITVAGHTFRFSTLHHALVKETGPSEEELLQEEQARELQGFRDSVEYYLHSMDSSNTRFWLPRGDYRFFDVLFARLDAAQADSQIVRILHYGDSQIEMDRMTAQLRAKLMEVWGGGGPGLLPIRQTIPSTTVNQSSTGDLRMQSSYGSPETMPRAAGNYGPMTRCHHLVGTTQVSIRASKHAKTDDRAKSFSTITLLYNNRPGPLSATLQTTGQSHNESASGVHAMRWQTDSAVHALSLTLNGDADIYGIMVDDGPGVAVDNIAMRGCSGQQFCMINADQLQAAYSHMNVGLIIMQFGGNSVPYLRSNKSIEVYAASMGKQIDRLHQCCPDAKILFVGPSDMSTMVAGELRSYPYLKTVVSALRDTALSHGAAFWSIYDAMGGDGTMVAWARNGLAVSDYIHFSQRGVEVMGNRFADALLRMYEFYTFRRRIPQQYLDSIQTTR
ncbi:MAG: hypothetical protein IJV22_01430 [Bacteroidales bacterium]|nr:hypothetical protein [Bacteroidales bacterium]